jgi:hypothetical protein
MSDPLAVHIPSLEEYRPGPAPSGNGSGASSQPQSPAATATAPNQTAQRRATRGFNVLIWRGRLATDPLLITSPNGTRFVRIRCLQDQPDRNGQPGVQGVEVVLFNERAEQFAAFFRKGDEVLTKGRLTIETKHDRDGTLRSTASLHPDGSIELLHRPQGHTSAA